MAILLFLSKSLSDYLESDFETLFTDLLLIK